MSDEFGEGDRLSAVTSEAHLLHQKEESLFPRQCRGVGERGIDFTLWKETVEIDRETWGGGRISIPVGLPSILALQGCCGPFCH